MSGAAERSQVRLLQAASATSSFDRFVVGPLLLTIAAHFDVSLARAAAVASLYFLLYGFSQPVWGLCSDRFGRVRTMRV
ncbi:MAG: major facilitator superfamily 1, partial [Frankiales bacterium]|nr:major facilitator superfamily 1 [Frankiales bacterium]